MSSRSRQLQPSDVGTVSARHTASSTCACGACGYHRGNGRTNVPPQREKQTGWKRHEWGVVGHTPGYAHEIAQCQVHSCGKFKVNDGRTLLTYEQLVKRHSNIVWL